MGFSLFQGLDTIVATSVASAAIGTVLASLATIFPIFAEFSFAPGISLAEVFLGVVAAVKIGILKEGHVFVVAEDSPNFLKINSSLKF